MSESKRFGFIFWICITSWVTMPSLLMSQSQAQKAVYPLSETLLRGRTQQPGKIEAHLSPELTYDLSRIQFAFGLTLRNRSSDTVFISDPVAVLRLQFLGPTSSPIEMPMKIPSIGINSVPPSRHNVSPIVFKKAIENGKEITIQRDSYQVMPGASIEIFFQCEPVVGERVMAAVANSREKFIYVRLFMPLMNQQDASATRTVVSQRIRLEVPRI